MSAAFLLASAVTVCLAQTQPSATKSNPVYRIQLTLRDTEAGQQPNIRKFMMVTEERDWGRLRTGGKVPYSTGAGQFNYADIGTNITCRVFEHGDQVRIDYEVELSSVAKIDAETRNPAMFQHKVSGTSTVALEKPTIVSTWDDAASKKRYEIEITPSKISQ